MRLFLALLVLAPVALAQRSRELEVKGRLSCPPHITADIWYFNVSLVGRPQESRISNVQVVDVKTVQEFDSFSLQSQDPTGHSVFILEVDGPKLCPGLPKYIPLDASKGNIDLGVVDLNKI